MTLTHQQFSATDSVDATTGRRVVTVRRRNAAATILAVFDLEAARDYLVGDADATLTLNAVVRVARFVSSKVAGVNYQIPTDLVGTPADYPKIYPDAVILGAALLQAAANRSIDGQPGPSFVRFVMGQFATTTDNTQRLLKFMDETPNKTLADAQGALKFPELDSPEADLYRYFRRLVHVRNGLWSDQPFVVNLVGIRRKKGAAGAGKTWNDTLLACWMGEDDLGRPTPRARVFVGTTEPGNTLAYPTVPAQTYIVRLGYHHAQQPGGRGYRIVARDSENKDLRFDRSDWRGINFHSGGSTGRPTGFKKGALPGGTAVGGAQVETHLVLTELFAILSRWGLNDSKTSLEHLRTATTRVLPVVTIGIDKRTITVTQKVGSQNQSKQIDVEKCRSWIADTWVRVRKRTEVVYRILRSVDPAFVVPANGNTLSVEQVKALITTAHILAIVRRQAEVLGDIDEVDGLPGTLFLDIIAQNITSAASAGADLARAEALLKSPNLLPSQAAYVRGLRFNTAAERAALATGKTANPLDFKAFEVEESIGTWSVACQVAFGCEQFYRYWRHVTRNVVRTGQTNWYYTVVEYNSLV